MVSVPCWKTEGCVFEKLRRLLTCTWFVSVKDDGSRQGLTCTVMETTRSRLTQLLMSCPWRREPQVYPPNLFKWIPRKQSLLGKIDPTELHVLTMFTLQEVIRCLYVHDGNRITVIITVDQSREVFIWSLYVEEEWLLTTACPLPLAKVALYSHGGHFDTLSCLLAFLALYLLLLEHKSHNMNHISWLQWH